MISALDDKNNPFQDTFVETIKKKHHTSNLKIWPSLKGSPMYLLPVCSEQIKRLLLKFGSDQRTEFEVRLGVLLAFNSRIDVPVASPCIIKSQKGIRFNPNIKKRYFNHLLQEFSQHCSKISTIYTCDRAFSNTDGRDKLRVTMVPKEGSSIGKTTPWLPRQNAKVLHGLLVPKIITSKIHKAHFDIYYPSYSLDIRIGAATEIDTPYESDPPGNCTLVRFKKRISLSFQDRYKLEFTHVDSLDLTNSSWFDSYEVEIEYSNSQEIVRALELYSKGSVDLLHSICLSFYGVAQEVQDVLSTFQTFEGISKQL